MDEGTEDISDEPIVPDGTAQIVEIIKSGTNALTVPTSFVNDAAGKSAQSAAQKALDFAFDQVDGTTTAITIVLSKGTYTGDLKISKETLTGKGKTVNDNLEVRLVSESVYKEAWVDGVYDATRLAATSGSDFILDGNLNAQGIKVVLAGIYLSLGKIVEAKNAAMTVYGTTGADTITVKTSQQTALSILAGDGDDTVSVTASGSGGISLYAGAGNDTVVMNTSGTDETIENTFYTELGEGKNSLSVNAAAGKLEVDVEGGSGNDTVTLMGGKHAVVPTTSWRFVLGDGSNKVTVDASVAKATQIVMLGGGAGKDTLALTGSLKKNDANAVSGSRTSIHLKNDSDRELTISLTDFDVFTDELKNKTTNKITTLTGITPTSFTDYEYTGSLTNALQTGDTLWSGDLLLTTLKIGKEGSDDVRLGTMNMPQVVLTVNAKTITVEGAVTAAEMTLTAKDGDAFAIKKSDVLGEGTTGDLYSGSFFDFESESKITITATGSLKTTRGDITLKAVTEQTHGLLDLLGEADDGLNFFNVKVGRAAIEILGTQAGSGQARTASIDAAGAIKVSATDTLKMEVSNKLLAYLELYISADSACNGGQ